VVALAEKPPEQLVRFADQPHWRDPDSGYTDTPRRRCGERHRDHRRRFAGRCAGAVQPVGRNAFTQQLLMLEGTIALHIDATTVRLRDADCLDFDVMRAAIFENETKQDARYVIFTRRGASYRKM